MHQLLDKVFGQAFRNPSWKPGTMPRNFSPRRTGGHDHGFLCRAPLFFPGGDIGSLAVHGT